MHYELNVSKDGQHVFATHPRSVVTEREAARLYVLFEQAFPPAEGYQIMVERIDETHTRIRPDQLPLEVRRHAWADPCAEHHDEHLARANDGPKRVVTDVKDMTPAERETVDRHPLAGFGVKVVDGVVVPLTREEHWAQLLEHERANSPAKALEQARQSRPLSSEERAGREVRLPSGRIVGTTQGEDPSGG